jgi:hypothetical protein
LPTVEKSAASRLIVRLGLAAVGIPGLCFLIGAALSSVIPGCHCDEGAGCHGCGADGLIGFLLLGGFVGALAALIFILPASFILAAIVNAMSKPRR